MAVVHFTVKEVREMLEAVTPGYETEYEQLREQHEQRVVKYKQHRDEKRKEREEEPARREAILHNHAKDDFEKQEAWRDAHRVRSFFGGKWKSEEEFYEERRRTTIWGIDWCYDLHMWRYPNCPEHANLTFCKGLFRRLEGYKEDRVVGLQPGELEILRANEITT